MNTFALVLLGLVLSVCSLTEHEYRTAFSDFKTQYGKTYLASEEPHRYQVFVSNLDFVNSWDAEARGFTVAINKFADLTAKEFGAMYNGLSIQKEKRAFVDVVEEPIEAVDVDWRTKGAVTSVKDQGQCGSCWAFSSTGSIEGAYFLAKGKLVSVSEQNLVDCSVAEGNQGCNGGLMDQAFEYVIKNKGIDTEVSYSYKARGPLACQYKAADIGATISSYKDIPEGSESALANAVAITPVSVAIDASHQSFQMYSSGIYYEPACSATSLDHGVLAVGYGSNGANADYWIVKNSWGGNWGMNGYINMARNRNNNCGIATAASYPIV